MITWMKYARHRRHHHRPPGFQMTVTFLRIEKSVIRNKYFQDDYVVRLNDLYKRVQLWVDIIEKTAQAD